MIYVTVTTSDSDTGWNEFWIEEDHKGNLLAALGLLSSNMTIAEAMALADVHH